MAARKRKTQAAADHPPVFPMTEAAKKARKKMHKTLAGAHKPITAVEDEPGGGFRLFNEKQSEMVVGGLHEALRTRVFAEGVEHVTDSGPSSRELGKRVHRHVFHLTECILHELPCRCGTRAKTFKGISRQALEIFRTVRARGLMCVASEVAIIAPRWNLATRVDLLCTDIAGRLVLVSVKTGAAKTSQSERTMRGGLSHVHDTEATRHQAQLAAERLILKEAGIELDGAFIIYCRPGKKPAIVVPMDGRLCSEAGERALDDLLRTEGWHGK